MLFCWDFTKQLFSVLNDKQVNCSATMWVMEAVACSRFYLGVSDQSIFWFDGIFCQTKWAVVILWNMNPSPNHCIWTQQMWLHKWVSLLVQVTVSLAIALFFAFFLPLSSLSRVGFQPDQSANRRRNWVRRFSLLFLCCSSCSFSKSSGWSEQSRSFCVGQASKYWASFGSALLSL